MRARALLSRLGNDPVFALSVSVAYAAAVAWVDYSTNYELRFGVLYVPAVFLATWGAGWVAGIGIGVAVAAVWIATLSLKYPYAAAWLQMAEGTFHLLMYVAFALITARLKEALQLAQERFVSAFDSLDAAACVVDPQNGELLYANPQFLRTFSSMAAAPAGRELARRFGAGSAGELPDGEGFDVDSGRWYYVLSRAMRWLDGRQVRLNVATDITEAKRAERRAREQQEQLERTARLIAVGEMASTLAHELNQPLGAIANYNSSCVRLLRTGTQDTAQLLELMEKCSTQALRAGEVVRRIREFVRKRPPAFRPESPLTLVTDAVSHAEGELHHAQPDIRVDVPRNLPHVSADRTMVAKVMVNLARNAADAMAETPVGERRIVLRARLQGQQVEFQCEDQGPGVAPEIEERLFQPFLSSKPDGMGLGLAICRSIVEYHRGELWFTRNPAGGSTFHFTLPVADA